MRPGYSMGYNVCGAGFAGQRFVSLSHRRVRQIKLAGVAQFRVKPAALKKFENVGRPNRVAAGKAHVGQCAGQDAAGFLRRNKLFEPLELRAHATARRS